MDYSSWGKYHECSAVFPHHVFSLFASLTEILVIWTALEVEYDKMPPALHHAAEKVKWQWNISHRDPHNKTAYYFTVLSHAAGVKSFEEKDRVLTDSFISLMQGIVSHKCRRGNVSVSAGDKTEVSQGPVQNCRMSFPATLSQLCCLLCQACLFGFAFLASTFSK